MIFNHDWGGEPVAMTAQVVQGEVCWPQMLRVLRGTRYWTRAQLAAQLRVTSTVLRDWEDGVATPDISVQRQVRDILGRPVEEAHLAQLVRQSPMARYLFRTDRPPQTGKPSRILELSDRILEDQPLGRDVFMCPRTSQQVELTAGVDAMLNSRGRFYGGEMVMATARTIWLQYVQGGMTVRHALSRWVPMRLPDGMPVCIYERRTVTPSAYMSLPAEPIFTPLDEMVV